MKVLVLDDQPSGRRVLKLLLAELGNVETEEAESLVQAKRVVQEQEPDLVLVDVRLSDNPLDRGGLTFLRWLRDNGNAVPAVVVTNSSELAEVREAMRLGAQDYVLKDELCSEMFLPIIRGLRERLQLKGKVDQLRRKMDSKWGVDALIGTSSAMERVRRLVTRVANADAPVLIRGPTGTGKEMAARAIHQASHRADEPFVAINCSALPANLIESMIFGHHKGAFTGADRRVRGHLELAGAGTILFDEIAEMPAELQAKLLRVLENRHFRPLGAESDLKFEARVLAATHVDLEARIRAGTFREDLFYRLNVVSIDLPALAVRDGDIPELVYAFSQSLPCRLRFTAAAIAWLKQRRWPGNVRELRNALERLALLAEHEIVDVSELESLIGNGSDDQQRELEKLVSLVLALPSKYGPKLDVIERALVRQAMQTSGGNKSAAARLLGVDRKALERRWERLSGETAPLGDEPEA